MDTTEGARHPLAWHFPRLWAARHDAPRVLPNGVDYTDPRGSIRDNIRGQRATRRYEESVAGDKRDWSHYPAASVSE